MPGHEKIVSTKSAPVTRFGRVRPTIVMIGSSAFRRMWRIRMLEGRRPFASAVVTKSWRIISRTLERV